MPKNFLSIAGLTNWEAQVYEALLKLGESKSGSIIQESKVPQSKIYSVLDMLSQKGLVTYMKKNGVKHFSPAPVSRLLTLYKQNEEELAEILKKISQKQITPTSVELFVGFRAIRVIHSELLENTKETKLYGYSKGELYSDETLAFYNWWGERKKFAGISDHLLITKKEKEYFEKKIEQKYAEVKDYVKSKTRYCDLTLPTDTLIFGDTVIFYHWLETPQIIVIKDKNIAQNYKEFFLQLWD